MTYHSRHRRDYGRWLGIVVILLLGGWIAYQQFTTDDKADTATSALSEVADACKSGGLVAVDEQGKVACQKAPEVVEQVGAPGLSGAAGQSGAIGPIGPIGPGGSPGIPGMPGVDGQRGLGGTDGADGSDGQPGMDGQPGVDGVDGVDGAPGPDCPPGTHLEPVIFLGGQMGQGCVDD